MKRKQYVHKLWNVAIQMNKKFPDIYKSNNGKLGKSFRYMLDHAKDVPKTFGSYEKAWNSEAMVELRKMLAGA